MEIEGGDLRLNLTQSVGPRVIALQVNGDRNLFAELPDETLECPGVGDYHLYGGHRLWYAPEIPSRTYLPDDEKVEIQEVENGIKAIQSPEPGTGIQKSIELAFGSRPSEVVVEHTIRNGGREPIECAPWAITQLKSGGVAFLPQFEGHINGNPYLPNRSLVIWPYTDIGSASLGISNSMVTVSSKIENGALKVGLPNPAGWIAYWIDQTLFVKEADFDPDDDYLDFSASSQCYANPRFLELETLGPRTILNPGEEIRHRERWRAIIGVRCPSRRSDIESLIEQEGEK